MVLGNPVLQDVAGDPEKPSRRRLVPVLLLERLNDEIANHVVESRPPFRELDQVAVVRGRPLLQWLHRHLPFRRQRARLERIVVGQRQGVLQNIGEFTNVAGPASRLELGDRVRGEQRGFVAGELTGAEMLSLPSMA